MKLSVLPVSNKAEIEYVLILTLVTALLSPQMAADSEQIEVVRVAAVVALLDLQTLAKWPRLPQLGHSVFLAGQCNLWCREFPQK